MFRLVLICTVLIIAVGRFAAFNSHAHAQTTSTAVPDYVIAAFGHPPPAPDGALSKETHGAINVGVVGGMTEGSWGVAQTDALSRLAATDDPRLAWIMSDALRYAWDRDRYEAISDVAASLLGLRFKTLDRWAELTDHLIAWDTPAYPGYLADKRALFTHFGPGWGKLFVEGDIDWRHVSWGGVDIDDRPYGQTDKPCAACIPAVDDPKVVPAADATWLQDTDVIFGISVNGEARAYPRRIMEIREMVNDTLGGRALGIPYCTLCGAAQAYFTDAMPDGIERPILRTSGLLIRSNKVMYDVVTDSVFDTFTGQAVTGPLSEQGIHLQQTSVITSNWGRWKQAYPHTTVLVEELALGRDYNLRHDRDADGPIFPVGNVDPRLAAHEDVVGVITVAGQPVAFQRSAAMAALKNGADVRFEDIRLILDAGGVRAVDTTSADRSSHQAFWFAWSQFHPETALWPE